MEVFSQLQALGVLPLAKTHPEAMKRFSKESFVENENIAKD
jgi:hypothetical protein